MDFWLLARPAYFQVSRQWHVSLIKTLAESIKSYPTLLRLSQDFRKAECKSVWDFFQFHVQFGLLS